MGRPEVIHDLTLAPCLETGEARFHLIRADDRCLDNSSTLVIAHRDRVVAHAGFEGVAGEQNVGQLQIAGFANVAGLQAIGGNLFEATNASGTATAGNPGSTGFGELIQGFLETSNVNTVSEITNLITAQRAYEMNSKVIQTADDMLDTINRLR